MTLYRAPLGNARCPCCACCAGGALGGEELARQLHEAELARLEGRGEEGGSGGGAGRQKRQKPKPSVRWVEGSGLGARPHGAGMGLAGAQVAHAQSGREPAFPS